MNKQYLNRDISRQAIELYNGISPETVKEMVETLRELNSVYQSKGQLLAFDVSIATRALNKVEREMKP